MATPLEGEGGTALVAGPLKLHVSETSSTIITMAWVGMIFLNPNLTMLCNQEAGLRIRVGLTRIQIRPFSNLNFEVNIMVILVFFLT